MQILQPLCNSTIHHVIFATLALAGILNDLIADALCHLQNLHMPIFTLLQLRHCVIFLDKNTHKKFKGVYWSLRNIATHFALPT